MKLLESDFIDQFLLNQALSQDSTCVEALRLRTENIVEPGPTLHDCLISPRPKDQHPSLFCPSVIRNPLRPQEKKTLWNNVGAKVEKCALLQKVASKQW
jgi:hypothetical protein